MIDYLTLLIAILATAACVFTGVSLASNRPRLLLWTAVCGALALLLALISEGKLP